MVTCLHKFVWCSNFFRNTLYNYMINVSKWISRLLNFSYLISIVIANSNMSVCVCSSVCYGLIPEPRKLQWIFKHGKSSAAFFLKTLWKLFNLFLGIIKIKRILIIITRYNHCFSILWCWYSVYKCCISRFIKTSNINKIIEYCYTPYYKQNISFSTLLFISFH